MRTAPLALLALLLFAPVVRAADEQDDVPGSEDAPNASLAIASSEGDFEDADEEERIEAALRRRDPEAVRVDAARASYQARERRSEGPELVIARECLGDATRAGVVDWLAADACSRRRISARRATE